MAYPVSGTPYPSGSPVATPPYSGTFIPEIWSGKLIEKFYAATVLAAISNTDYEGEIKNHGDKVQIRTKPTIQINDYQADMPLAAQRPAAANVTLAIDKGKYFNCILDDVMEIQSDINMMSMWSDDAGEQMKIVIDQQVLGPAGNGGILHCARRQEPRRRRRRDHRQHQPRRHRHSCDGGPAQPDRRRRSKSSTSSCAWARRSTSRTSRRRGAGS